MGRHRAEVRPRYGRIAVLGSALAVTLIAVLGGTGVLPSTADDTGAALDEIGVRSSALNEVEVATDLSSDSPGETSTPGTPGGSGGWTVTEIPTQVLVSNEDRLLADAVLPADSGEGKRVVYSEGRQRVWLVEESSDVLATYLVSGSLYDNLDPGTFEVYSRSEEASGIDDSGTMKYFVRFTTGDTGAAIGFHDIPFKDGKALQGFADLGTPKSHGCIRQRRSDARALWDFAPLGTTVVVTA